MIKRRFYKLEHGDNKDEPSDSSSSSSSFSEPESEAEAFGEEFESGGDGASAAPPPEEAADGCSTSSGYESEDSSANEVDIDSSGHPINDEDDDSGDELRALGYIPTSEKHASRFLDKQSDSEEENEPMSKEFPACVLKCRSVFKCRLCPRIVCLNEDSLRVHLKSKRHSRSEKLLNEGRLKATLNSDGEIENEDTLTKEDAEIALVSKDKRKREKGGRQRQSRRRQSNKLKKKKVEQNSDVVKARSAKESPAKKRRKQDK